MKFLELIEKYEIEIPLIQRDYVQGLDEKKAVKFLKAIKNGMKVGLNLDFIYGNQNDKKFIPIDGQQRLTTLFLIYYYLSLENDYIEELKKFSYAIRPSSKDFISNLTDEKNWEKLSKTDIKEQIINSNWYFLSWENDLTIKSMLEMLNFIEQIFKDSDINDLKKIDFHFLNLDEYNLGEDLYIKMNARGKQLSNFENFKAEFEKFINSPIIKAKLDNEWLDIFWKLNYKKVDDYYYHFFFNTTFNFYVENNNIDKNFLTQKEIFDFYENVYPKYLNEVITILDNLQNYPKLKEFCEIKAEAKYYERLHFYIWSLGVLKNFDAIQMNRWQRVCKNLIENTRIDEPEIFQNILREIKKLNNTISQNVYQEIDFKNIGKFSSEQIKEEQLKIELILSNPKWENEFIKAEKNWYLDGKIGFLLSYADNDFDKFVEYRDKFIKLWDFAKENRDNQILLYQALLTKGDYLPEIGSNYTFCNFETAIRAKSDTWHKVFNDKVKSNYLKDLLDDFNKNDIQNSLENIKQQWIGKYDCNNSNDKTKYLYTLISNSENIKYCNKHQIRFGSYNEYNEVYLLKKTQMNGKHAELYTYNLFTKFLENKQFPPFTKTWYFETSSWEQPCAVIDNYKNYAIDIYFNDGFEIYFYKKKNDNLVKITNNYILNILKNHSFEELDTQFKYQNKFALCEMEELSEFLKDFTKELNNL